MELHLIVDSHNPYGNDFLFCDLRILNYNFSPFGILAIKVLHIFVGFIPRYIISVEIVNRILPHPRYRATDFLLLGISGLLLTFHIDHDLVTLLNT